MADALHQQYPEIAQVAAADSSKFYAGGIEAVPDNTARANSWDYQQARNLSDALSSGVVGGGGAGVLKVSQHGEE